ncbi:hypothetical protein LT493_11940 [Streptomyces tricolor]|nr:hypothetical protein [Streptomyces tricolor]
MRTARAASELPYLLPDPDRPATAPDTHPYQARADLREDVALAGWIVHRAGLELLVLDQTRPNVGRRWPRHRARAAPPPGPGSPPAVSTTFRCHGRPDRTDPLRGPQPGPAVPVTRSPTVAVIIPHSLDQPCTLTVSPQLVNLWSLRQDIVVDLGTGPEDPILLETPWAGPPDQGAERRPARGLCAGCCSGRWPSATSWPRQAVAPGGAEGLLEELRPLQHPIVRTLAIGAVPLLSVVPVSGRARFTGLKPLLGRICAGLAFRRDPVRPGRPVHRVSIVDHKVDLHHPGVMGMLGRIDGTADDVDAPTRPVVEAVRAYLVAAGVLVIADRLVRALLRGGPRSGASTGWSPDELLVHSRQPAGALGRPRGAAFAQAGRMPAAAGGQAAGRGGPGPPRSADRARPARPRPAGGHRPAPHRGAGARHPAGH